MATGDKLVNLEDLKVVGDAVGDLKTAVDKIMPVDFDMSAITVTATNEGYKIDTLGGVGVLSGSNVKRYAVTAGNMIRIDVANGISPTKWVFKSSNSGVNTNVVGTCHTDYGTIYTTVPTGATYIFIAVDTGDTTSGVYNVVSKTVYDEKRVLCGGIYVFMSGGYLRIRCESTARLYYNSTAVNCSSWVLDTAVSDQYLKYVCFNGTAFSLSAKPDHSLGILGFVYNYKFYPLQDFVYANTIPFEGLYQRTDIPMYINNRKIDVNIRPAAMSSYATDYGYFWKCVNGYNYANIVGLFDKNGRCYKTLSIAQNTASLANKKVLTIGDSVTNRGWYQKQLQTYVPTLQFVGTKQTQYNSLMAEGYSGCRADQVLTGSTITEGGTTLTNPFWDGSKIDFAYYCTHNSISPDIVIIEFGLNENNSNNYYTAIKNFITTITAYNSSIKVYVIQPFGTADLPSTNNINNIYKNVIKQCVCETYSLTGCKLIPCYYMMVDEMDYTSANVNYGYDVTISGVSDSVHPSEAVGFKKLADQIYNYLGL